MPTWAWILIIVGAAIVVLIAVAAWKARRTKTLQQTFGPEYDRVTAGTESKREAQKVIRPCASANLPITMSRAHRPASPAGTPRPRSHRSNRRHHARYRRGYTLFRQKRCGSRKHIRQDWPSPR